MALFPSYKPQQQENHRPSWTQCGTFPTIIDTKEEVNDNKKESKKKRKKEKKSRIKITHLDHLLKYAERFTEARKVKVTGVLQDESLFAPPNRTDGFDLRLKDGAMITAIFQNGLPHNSVGKRDTFRGRLEVETIESPQLEDFFILYVDEKKRPPKRRSQERVEVPSEEDIQPSSDDVMGDW
ncbi:hypothetical protein PROFUN_06111 [Planoprotostelium fungivorum]|uniref:Uncharacterized protein n=1 Tax=Planoprotostelium fungivorum TaxID=1890364 RepID=A0A2P6NPD8_9EUKA|nr:hypothetical protein PROFUN_06111 [Planoprotostelium fungivorum]